MSTNTPLDDNDLILVDRYDPSTGGNHTAITGASLRSWTGWGDFVDTEYNISNVWNPTVGQWNAMPNNAGGGPRSQVPPDNPLYENGLIVGQNGDSLVIGIEFIATPTANNNTFMDLAIDIGGSIGRIYPKTLNFPRGQGTPRNFVAALPVYTLGTWEANGGQVQLNPSAAVDVYDIRYIIQRTHKARS